MKVVFFECVSTDPFGNQTHTIHIKRMQEGQERDDRRVLEPRKASGRVMP